MWVDVRAQWRGAAREWSPVSAADGGLARRRVPRRVLRRQLPYERTAHVDAGLRQCRSGSLCSAGMRRRVATPRRPLLRPVMHPAPAQTASSVFCDPIQHPYPAVLSSHRTAHCAWLLRTKTQIGGRLLSSPVGGSSVVVRQTRGSPHLAHEDQGAHEWHRVLSSDGS